MISAIETTDSKTYANEHILAAVEVSVDPNPVGKFSKQSTTTKPELNPSLK
jgi:hypothetical protein